MDPIASLKVVQLLRASRTDLDSMFARSDAGPIPNGEFRGTLILPLGSGALRGTGALIGRLAWRGKVFESQTGRVTNRILPFGLRAITADVQKGASWLDGRECIVLDYSRKSLVAHSVHDELRLLGPGLYLGRAYWRRVRVVDFALEVRRPIAASAR